MRIRFTLGALLAVMAALLVAVASPALAKGGGGGGGGGATAVPAAGCAHIVAAIVTPIPSPTNVHPLPGQAYVPDLGVPSGAAVAFELTVDNQCIDEGGGPRSSLAVTSRSYDTATGALLFTGVNMQPAGMLMTWRCWVPIPTGDTTAPARTVVYSLVKANGQVQDTLTDTADEVNQAVLTAVATQTPQSIGHR